tara:strand:- start:20191 stop:21207 length:1017 start_codon:yes stop_codon:yes gene_type:complete
MDFRSDNTASTHPLVLEGLSQANHGNSASYGNDELSIELRKALTKFFDQELKYVLTSTGTAANCVALRSICPVYGTILTTQEAHLHNDEGQAPELLLSGAKLRTFSTPDRKLDLVQAKVWVEKAISMKPHAAKACVISITQSSEWGDIYSLQELRDIRAFCDHYKLLLHIDGARLSNALVAQNLSAKEFIKIARPDVLSFGLTKNGALMAEAVILFNLEFSDSLAFCHKQVGQLMSKTRFYSAQFLAMLKDDLWRDLAQQANEHALKLSQIFTDHSFELALKTKTNQVFVKLPAAVAKKLQSAGAQFYPWQDDTYRFVSSWMSSEDDLLSLKKVLSDC